MAAYELKYTAEEIDGILESVDEKTIYDDATQSEHGLMSAEDKAKVDAIPENPKYTDTVYDDTDLAGRVSTIEGKESGWDAKQEALVSGTNIKTINNTSLLGSGNIEIQGGGGSGEENVIEAITMNGDSVPVTDKTAAITETDPTVPSWAKQQTKPSYNYSEIGNTPDLSGYATTQDLDDALENTPYYTYVEDEGGVLGDDTEKPFSFIKTESGKVYAIGEQNSGGMEDWVLATTSYVIDAMGNLATVATSGSYNDLDDKPTIPTVPTNVSAFNNDAGYLTEHQDLSNYIQKSQTAGLIKNDGTVDTTQYGTYSKPSGGIPAGDLASGVIPDVSGKEDSSNKVTSFQTTPDDTHYPSEKLVKDYVDGICGDIQTILISI